MTRINAYIPVANLCDQHLLAEHREIKRVCNRFKARLDKNDFSGIPDNFTLGKGHELFFILKPHYTLARYSCLHSECIKRGFSVTNFQDNWQVYSGSQHLFQQYKPSVVDDEIVKSRITERLKGMKSIRYYGKNISTEEAIELLKKH